MILTKQITTVETVKIDVDLPYFTKDEDFHYAIISEDDCIRVKFKEYLETIITPSVEICFNSLVENAAKGEPITQKEFEDFYTKANDYLSEQFEKMRDAVMNRSNAAYDEQEKSKAA